MQEGSRHTGTAGTATPHPGRPTVPALPTPAAGSEEDGAAARALFAAPDWRPLARPLFRCVQTAVLSHCKSRAATAGGGAGGKKERDPAEGMTQVGG